MTTTDLLNKVQDVENRWKLHMDGEEAGLSEEATDALYAEYHESAHDLAAMLVEATGGAIDKKTAIHMAHWKRTEIANLMK